MKKAFEESGDGGTAVAEPVENIETVENGGGETSEPKPEAKDSTGQKNEYDFEEPSDGEDIPAEDDKGGEEAPAKKQDPEPAASTAIDAALVERAKSAGLDDAEIGTFDDPKALTKTLDLIEKRIKPMEKSAEKPTAEAKKPFEKYKVELDPELYDPDTIKTIEGMNEHYATIVNDLGEKLSAATASLETTKAVEFENRFDVRIGELGENYKDVLGEGSGSEMDKESAEYKNRMKILDEMEAVALGYQAKGMKMPKESELFEKAVRNVFPEKAIKIATKQISDKLKKRAGQLSNRPSNRHAAGPVNPEAAARNFVKQFLADNDESEGEQIEF